MVEELPKKKKKKKPSALIRSVLKRKDENGNRLYSEEESLNTLTCFLLGVLVKGDVTTFNDTTKELVTMAMLHAGLHVDMTQEQFDDGILRFLAAYPPNEALLEELAKVFRKITIRAEKRAQKKASMAATDKK